MKYLKRFQFAFSGIFYALMSDKGFQYQLILGGVVIPPVVIFCYPLSQIEQFFLTISFLHILITELQNSSLEATLDHLHPEHHSEVGKSKDMAAGAVLLAGFFFLFVVATIVLSRIFI